MADKKISALTGATTPLAGTEVLPIVQSGSTVKVSVANLTAGRTISASALGVGTSTPSYAVDTSGQMRAYNTPSSFAELQLLAQYTGSSGPAAIGQGSDGTTYAMNLANADFVIGTNSTEKLRIGATGNITAANGNLVVGTAGKGIDFSANTNAPGMTSELLDWYEEGDWTPTYTGWSTDPTTTFAKYTRIGRLVTLNYTALDGVSLTGSSEIGGLPFTSSSQQGASVLMKDISGAAVSAFGGIGANTNSIGAITSATFTGLYWSFSVSYIV